MRTCRSDADIIEAFPAATEEGLKFFKDPSLLCEKFVSLYCLSYCSSVYIQSFTHCHIIYNQQTD